MTKHLLSALATAVVTTKMINTQAGRFARDAPLAVMLAASLRSAVGAADTCLPWATGRARRTAQPDSGRR
jgi:hypothetical protein